MSGHTALPDKQVCQNTEPKLAHKCFKSYINLLDKTGVTVTKPYLTVFWVTEPYLTQKDVSDHKILLFILTGVRSENPPNR